MVGMAEVKVTRSSEEVLVALGLGSCVGICAYDPKAGVAGMAHVVLPMSAGQDQNPGKFADTALPQLLSEMSRLGAIKSRIRVALAGGAQLFSINTSGPRMEIGARNIAAIKEALEKSGLPILATDVGGKTGRTVHLFADGRVRVKTIGMGEKDLVTL